MPAKPAPPLPPPPARRLIGDIGGTNARFALATPAGGWHDERVYPCAAFPGPAEAIAAYLAAIGQPGRSVTEAALCVACPVLDDRVALTNGPWAFSIATLRATLGLESLRVVNDFAANALACPHLDPDHLVAVGGGQVRDGFPLAAIGPGTGLGVALLIPDPDLANGRRRRWLPIAGEGGHVTLPAATARQQAVIAAVAETVGHVSAERLVCGAGLALLHGTLRRLDGLPPLAAPLDPAAVSAAALAGTDPQAVEAVELFGAFLGGVAGNLALTAGALGGVYILGGIAPRLLGLLRSGPFRESFLAKGRFRPYLEAVPTWVVTHPYPAFLGLARL